MIEIKGRPRAWLSTTAKPALFGLVAAAFSWLVLIGALQAGLAVPTEEYLAPLARARALDYSGTQTGPFSSLREAFIAQVLGLDPKSTPVLAGSSGDDGPSLGSSSSSGPTTLSSSSGPPILPAPPPSQPGPLPRTIVEHPFDNDDFDDAYPVSTIPFTGKTDNRDARQEPGEPVTCEPVGGTVWYRYSPGRNTGLLANTFGTDHSSALAVFHGRDLATLEQIDNGCDVNAAGNAQVAFPAKKGRDYYFQVTAPAGGGKLVFSLDPLGTTELASVSWNGKSGANSSTSYASVSANGRYVAFSSYADNLLPPGEDSNPCEIRGNWDNCPDVFVRDMASDRTERVSVSSSGKQANASNFNSAISDSGRYVAFFSYATNLVHRDHNQAADVFVHNRLTGKTERVSVSSAGKEGRPPDLTAAACSVDRGIEEALGEYGCYYDNHDEVPGISISADGRYVAFASSLRGLVDKPLPQCIDLTGEDGDSLVMRGPGVPIPADAGQYSCRQIYVHDRATHKTVLVSASSKGTPGEGDSAAPYISKNGRWISFSSSAPKLVADDENRYRDVFVHDLRKRTTEIVSVSSSGEQGDEQSGGTNARGYSSVSDDGRWVTFVSNATNLAPGDGNFVSDVYLRDRKLDRTVLISNVMLDSPERERLRASGASHASITSDGRYIAITAHLEDPIDANFHQDVYVYDRLTRTMTRVSVATSGKKASGFSGQPDISSNGRFIGFSSQATNFDDRDSSDGHDVYIHELPWVR